MAALGLVVAGAIATTTAAAAADPVTLVHNDFEDGTYAPWGPRGGVTLGVVEEGHDSARSLQVSNRTANWQGVAVGSAGLLEPGGTYDVTAWVKLPAGTETTTGIHLTAEQVAADGSGNTYTWIGGNVTATAGEWLQIGGTYQFAETFDSATIYVEAAEPTASFLVDDVRITGEAAGPEVTVVTGADFEDGTTGTWTQSGSATLEVVPDGDGGQALSITRDADYEGLQSPTGLFEPGVTYDFSMRARLPEGATGTPGLRFVMKPDYTWIGNTTISADGWTTLTGSWTAPADLDPAAAQVYLGTENLTGEYTLLVDDILVTTQAAPPTGLEPGTVLVDTGFEDQTLQGWAPRQPNDTAPTVAVVAGGADSTAFAAQVSDRDSDGDGLQLDVTEPASAGTTLEYEAWVRFAEGEPAGELTLSARTVTAGVDGAADTEAFSNLAAITTARNDGWVKVGGQFTMPSYDKAAELYFESKYNSGNVSSFLVDEVRVWVPEPPVVDTSLTPLKDTIDIPGLGVAIDSRETTGNAAELTLHHFNQVSGENHMKVEAWYDAEQNFVRHPEATALLDFAQENDLRLYGHVLLWHSQTPEWFFQHEDGTPLTTSEADKEFLRQRLHDHIFDVAGSIAGDYGAFGSETNPLVAWDVVNEVVSDANEPGDGLRRSTWYHLLGEEFISLAFQYADEAFNEVYAAEGTDRPVTLFINDYNTEQSAKQDRYFALVERLLAAGVPVDGVGHQFHASLTTPIASLDTALTRFDTLPVVQAVTELDVTVGTPVTEGNLIKQGHWYRDAFDVFRAHAEDLYSVTVWGLTDTRSWRSEQAPLLFDGGLQAKYAYYGAAGDDEGVPPLITTANVFGGDVALDAAAPEDVAWRNLPAQGLTGSAGSFVPRWTADHLTLLVTVASDDSDAVEVVYEGQTYGITRDGAASGGATGLVLDDAGGWRAVLHVPHTGVAAGGSAQLDVRALAGTTVVGAWNSPGTLGTLTFLEDLSLVEVVAAAGDGPVVDGVVDEAWADANVVSTDKTVEGAADGASAHVRTLWKGNDTLYALFEVADPVIDVSSGDPWVQDSVELFVDLGNTKSGGFTPNDAQMRISVDNVRSFGTGDATAQAARLTSATARTATGYVVEVAVTLKGQSGGQNDVPFGGAETFQGLDFQVNDGRDGSRYSVRTWAEPTGTGYQSTARWGVGHLVSTDVVELVNVTAPAISGKAAKGSTLRASAGEWSVDDVTVTYQWLRDGEPIDQPNDESSGTGATYKVKPWDVGHQLSVVVTATADGLEPASAESAAVKVSGKKAPGNNPWGSFWDDLWDNLWDLLTGWKR